MLNQPREKFFSVFYSARREGFFYGVKEHEKYVVCLRLDFCCCCGLCFNLLACK